MIRSPETASLDIPSSNALPEVTLLRWAAGCSVGKGERDAAGETADVERLLELVRWHRLAKRLLCRLQEEQPVWASRNLYLRLLAEQGRVQDNLTRKRQALAEISAALHDPDHPLITIKWLTAHALTGTAHTVRFSGDIDVFAADPERLVETLDALGYQGKRHPEGVHEYATYFRDGIKIDVHRCTHVYSYPDGVLALPAHSAQREGIHFQAFGEMPYTRITYTDLWVNSTRGITPETGALTLPNVTMAAFLKCVHLFTDYISPPFRRPTAFRLVSVAETRELLAHPAFNRERFRILVERFHGQDAVSLMGALLHTFYGINAFTPDIVPERSADHFPRLLSYAGCWANVHRSDDLLRDARPDLIPRMLTTNSVKALADRKTNGPSSVYWFSTVPYGTRETSPIGVPLCHGLMRSVSDTPLRINFFLRREMEGFLVDLTWRCPLAATDELQIHLHAQQYQHGRGVILRDGGQTLYQGDRDDAVHEPFPGGGRVRFPLRWEWIAEDARVWERIPLVLSVARHTTPSTDFRLGDPAVIIPLEIQ